MCIVARHALRIRLSPAEGRTVIPAELPVRLGTDEHVRTNIFYRYGENSQQNASRARIGRDRASTSASVTTRERCITSAMYDATVCEKACS